MTLCILVFLNFQQLTGQQATPDHAASLLDDYFAVAHDTTTVVLADEVYTLYIHVHVYHTVR